MRLTASIDDRDVKNMGACCTRCACCTYSGWPEFNITCPLYARGKSLGASLGGVVFLNRAINEKKIELNQNVAEFAYTCTGCGLCDRCYILSILDPAVKPSDHIRTLRADLVRKGVLPEKVKQLYERVKQASDEKATKAPDSAVQTTGIEADTVIVAECCEKNGQGQVSGSVASLLGKIGKNAAVFAEEGFCGSTLYDFGFWDYVEPQVKKNWGKMKGLKDKTFVFTDPHCQEFIVNRYREFAPDYSEVKARHFSQILAEAFGAKALESKKNGKKLKVCYHDPCYLGRGLGVYDAPREVLTALDGVELVEMERNRKSSFCCGARALGDYYPDMAAETAKERMEEFRATGADVLITACTSCKHNFQNVLPEAERGRVQDLFAFVDERV
jgi:Fe-S oxidoreductase